MSNDTQIAALPPLPFAVFDEFGQGCEDRVADHYCAAVEASARQLAEQPGFVMVPVEPTPEMLRAVDDEADDKYLARGRAVSAWKAMIAARPLTASPSHTTTHVTDREPHPNAFMQVPTGTEVTAHWPALTASPTAPSTEEVSVVEPDERTEFEAWAIGILCDNPTWKESAPYELAWQSWQARALKGTP